MRIVGSAALPVLFDGDARVGDVEVRVVDGLPNGFIVGADFLSRNASVLDFSSSRGFRPVPAAPGVPFLSIAPYASQAASPLRNARDQFSLLTATPENAPAVPAVPTDVPSYEDVVWEDDTSFEWDVRQVSETIDIEGFTTRAVEAAAVGNLSRVWLDDILIASDTWEEYLATLTLVRNRLLAAGLSVNFAKCIFGAASQEFFGMITDSTGLYPAQSKLDAITRIPRPHTVEELRTFLGLTGYLLRASLMQTTDGVTSAVVFASHRFSQTDARRGPTERECMGVLWAVDQFRPWALRLMEYDLALEWKAGVEHVVPDALSRLPVANPVEVDVDDSFPDDLSFATGLR
ncbi:unnamed protein product [Ectocarpus sp. CCAP 1310/34]|nr:unnamed protein product [Ectocarpus sp. CCAP 1310/34]